MTARNADAVFYNGRVYTFEAKKKVVKAVAVADSRIIAVGTDKDVKGSAPRGCDKYDLGGKVVVPGFIDSHTHFINMGIDSMNVDLYSCSSAEEAIAKMKAGAKKSDPGEWVIGAGWMESRWQPSRFLTKVDLDAACPDRPAVAHRICGHLSSLNSKAIKELSFDADTADVEVSSSGELTGIVKESAVATVRAATAPGKGKKKRGLTAAIKRAHSLGVTSIQDNGEMEHLGLFRAAEKAGTLGVRVWFNVPSDNLSSMTDLSLSSGMGSEWLKIGGVKIFCDGALGARTAALAAPYEDDPSNKGMFVHSRDDLQGMISEAHSSGIQLAIHAIGDEGIDAVISCIESAMRGGPKGDWRHRIEHLELPTDQHLKRMQKARIIASMQPNFVGEWGGINGMYHERLGHDRAVKNNPFQSVLRAKVRMVFGSDCMPFSPIYGILSAVNAPYDTQRLTTEEAFSAYTKDAAFASFEEEIKGTIAEGKLADFIVLSDDPISHPKSLEGLSVLKTIIGGEVVYDRSKKTD